jgi:diacylglycerol kinase
VLTAELFNGTIEILFQGLDEAMKPRLRCCLDIAAGAVLLASIAAAVIVSIVFLGRLMDLFGWQTAL